jgi:hypothetical protein
MIAAIVLVVIAVICVVLGIMFFVEPAKSLPSFLGQIKHPAARAAATRPLHGAAALVIAVLCLVGAWFTSRGGKSANSSDSSAALDASSRS